MKKLCRLLKTFKVENWIFRLKAKIIMVNYETYNEVEYVEVINKRISNE